MKVWYIHPYAGGPGIGRYWRPYYFSKNWNSSGNQSIIISAAYHHLLEPDKLRYTSVDCDGVRYTYVPTIKYRGNSIRRIVSMLLFSIMLFPFCIIQAVKFARPNVIIYSSPHPYGVVGAWLAAKLLGAKFVLEVRDIWPLSLVELGGMKVDSLLVRVTGWIEKFAYTHAEMVISLLPCAEAHMLENGLAANKFIWIPNGVGLGEPEQNNASEKSMIVQHIKMLRTQGYFVVIYAGAHGEPNALEGLVRAARILERTNLKVKIILIGRGEKKADLVSYVTQASLTSVEFFDQQPKENIMAVLRIASAGYISLKSQPIFRFGVSPNKLWDYMLAELPVIFACKAGNDPVEKYGCGLQADPENPESIAQSISLLYLTSESERALMGQRGYSAVRQFYDYEQLAKNLLKALETGSNVG